MDDLEEARGFVAERWRLQSLDPVVVMGQEALRRLSVYWGQTVHARALVVSQSILFHKAKFFRYAGEGSHWDATQRRD